MISVFRLIKFLFTGCLVRNQPENICSKYTQFACNWSARKSSCNFKIESFESQQIHATDFASERSLTVGIVFIRVTCKLFEFIGFLYSGHVTFVEIRVIEKVMTS